jgi:amino acid adenylation domain-containing protein
MFLRRLRESFRTNAQRNALCIGDTFYTYRDLDRKAFAIAQLLPENSSSSVGVITHNDLSTYASLFAIWLSGKTAVPINPAFPMQRNEVIIQEAGIETILSSSNTDIFPGEKHTSEASPLPSAWPDEEPAPESIMYLLFTSGSTGFPKGVPVNYGNFDAFVNSFLANGYDFSPSDRFLQTFELTFDASLDSYVIPALSGACIYPVGSAGMRYLNALKVLQKHNITVAKMTPSMVALLKPYFPKIHLPALRYCLFGGEGLPEPLVTEWTKCIPGAGIHNLYGPTEATVECFFYDATPQQSPVSHRGFMSIGKPTAETIAVVTDTNNRILSSGQEGELCLSGPQVFEGYLNRPELNSRQFFNAEYNGKTHRFYRTGDLAVYNDEGLFFCLGRNDRQIKVQGYRVELDEIETAASKICNGKTAVVFREPEIILFTETSTENFAGKLSRVLPAWMLPAKIITLPSLPLNINGKTDYQKLNGYE